MTPRIDLTALLNQYPERNAYTTLLQQILKKRMNVQIRLIFNDYKTFELIDKMEMLRLNFHKVI